MPFRAGDIVEHGPSSERWTLALDEDGGNVQWCGYPLGGHASAGHCTLVRPATDGQRLETLKLVAQCSDGQMARKARGQLGILEPIVRGEGPDRCDTCDVAIGVDDKRVMQVVPVSRQWCMACAAKEGQI